MLEDNREVLLQSEGFVAFIRPVSPDLNSSTSQGWGQGYLIIPVDSIAYKYAMLTIEMNEPYGDYQPEGFSQQITWCRTNKDYLMIGFDTGHIFNSTKDNKEYVIMATKEMFNIVTSIDMDKLQKLKQEFIQQLQLQITVIKAL